MAAQERQGSASIDAYQLLNAIGDGVIVTGADGNVIFWNPASERIFGFTAEEALGRSLDLIIPERLRQRHWDGYDKTMSTGVTRYGTDLLRVPALHKDGHTLSIAFTVALVSVPTSGERAIAAVIRDETSRFNEERTLRKRLTELEAQLASRDK
jgi:PAS domain S-box-containing protein